jgi:hypothetical protein
MYREIILILFAIIIIFNINLFIILKILIIVMLIMLGLFILESFLQINPIKYYYNDYFNSDIVYFDDSVPLDIVQKSNYGFKMAKEKRIVFCCLARDIEEYIEKSIIKLEIIGKYFKDYKIVIFENDSSDNTRNLIKINRERNNKIILLDCNNMNSTECKLNNKKGYDYGMLSKQRIYKMAQYREQYLNYVKTNLSDYDYMMVCDMDLSGNQCIDGIFTSIIKSNWDAIYINGKSSYWGFFGLITITYDGLAFVNYNSEFTKKNKSGLEILLQILLMNSGINDSKEFYQVKSAFNGYALYKINSIKNASYIGDYNCEHINLSKNINDNGGKQYINKYWTGYFNQQGPTDSFTTLLQNIF